MQRRKELPCRKGGSSGKQEGERSLINGKLGWELKWRLKSSKKKTLTHETTGREKEAAQLLKGFIKTLRKQKTSCTSPMKERLRLPQASRKARSSSR